MLRLFYRKILMTKIKIKIQKIYVDILTTDDSNNFSESKGMELKIARKLWER